MRSSALLLALILATAGLLAACLGTGEDRVTSIDATGSVEGLVYFDANGSRAPESSDPPVALVGVRLLASGTGDTLARALSDQAGVFRMPAVPVGLYEIVVDPATIPDSLQLVAIDPRFLLTSRDDTTTSSIALSFPSASLEDARLLPEGERVFVEGIALNAQTTFGDQTLHLAGRSAAIRVLRVADPAVFAGDSVRVLGTTSALDGQPTLTNATVFALSIAALPPPVRLTTSLAASAAAATLDANLVQVVDATIADTATVADGFRLSVNDGSGLLAVLLDRDAPFLTPTAFVPGLVIDAVGLLVPDPGNPGTWLLKPRSDADLAVN